MLLGTGTFTYFSDIEISKDNFFQAGSLDLKIDCDSYTYDSDNNIIDEIHFSETDLTIQKLFNWSDLSPGIHGEATISLHVIDNNAWGCFHIDNYEKGPGETPEPEPTPDNGELAQNMNVIIWIDEGSISGWQGKDVDSQEGDNIWQETYEEVVFSGTLEELVLSDTIIDSTFWTRVIYSGTGEWEHGTYGTHSYEPPGSEDRYAECWYDGSFRFNTGLFTCPINLSGYNAAAVVFDGNFQDFSCLEHCEVNTYSNGIDLSNFEEQLLFKTTDDPAGGLTTVLIFNPTSYNNPSKVYIEFYYTNDERVESLGFSIDNVKVYGIDDLIIEYDETKNVNLDSGDSIDVSFMDWTPDDYGYISGVDIYYIVQACTQLTGDENPGNDCYSSIIKLTFTNQNDTGVTSINSPVSGPAGILTPEVTAENFGLNDQINLPINLQIEKKVGTSWIMEYDETVYINLNSGDTFDLTFTDWTPADWQVSENVDIDYKITSCTQLYNDENTSNDCDVSYITLHFPYFHDVKVLSINSPVDDGPGQTLPVEVTIKNVGQYEECCFLTNVQIGEVVGSGVIVEYDDVEAFSSYIQPGETLDLTFDDWTPEALAYGITQCIDYNVTACTEMSTDENPANDCVTEFLTLCYYHDVGVSEITSPGAGCWPPGTYDIKATVANFGVFAETDLTCYAEIWEYITDPINGTLVYYDSISNIDLDPLGDTEYLTFSDYTFAVEGLYKIIIYIPLSNDDNLANNCLSIFVVIREPFNHDVGTLSINSPTSGFAGTFNPEVTVKNFGLTDEIDIPVNLKIYKASGATLLLDEDFEGDIFPPPCEIGCWHGPYFMENCKTQYIGWLWEIPLSVGNEILDDWLKFDVVFYIEQHRNNPNFECPPCNGLEP